MTTLTIEPAAAGFLDRATETDSATRKYLERARRGKLPQYGSPSTRDMWSPDVVNYGNDVSDFQKFRRALMTGIVVTGVASLACMAQSYGAIDSSIIKGVVDIFGGPAIPVLGTGMASYGLAIGLQR